MDLYILPQDREEMIAALGESGLVDYFPAKDYDPRWIYCAHFGDVIVDTIWAMTNHRTDVDRDCLVRGSAVEFGTELVPVNLRKRSTVDPTHGCEHVRALDSRPWFRPLEATEEPEKERAT